MSSRLGLGDQSTDLRDAGLADADPGTQPNSPLLGKGSPMALRTGLIPLSSDFTVTGRAHTPNSGLSAVQTF
jgi:hypothetical protein